MSNFVVGGPEFTGLFRRTREELLSIHKFSDCGYLYRSGDIRDRILKLSEVDPNFARFWLPDLFGSAREILGHGF